ncbi:receptor-type guanylate cyclase gcy-8-like [Paramacrobiotus metropolitanus]|uniref:receptor-type guanylate cyclase gcy-8-like n=1 Tax=Paramacrobiotus metropolitanus TaxID=2943436 RepID=UPI0024456D99|nr:receptor-type guanylate cyclase gcy-8-like [Paramacrobiotus metropolitanus]
MLLSIIVITGFTGIQAAPVNLIIITIGDNPSYGYYAAAPYFDGALHVAEERYPRVFSNYSKQIFHKPGLPACPDAAAEMFAVTGEIYDAVMRTDGFTMLLSPGCSPELMPLGDLAREIDVPLLASTSADPMFANRKRYPTMLTFGAVGQGAHAAAARAFLRYYRWKTLTLFCDDLLKYTSIAAFLSANCRAMKTLFSVPGEFEFYMESYDSRSNPDYEARLRRARSQSRVIILLTRADELRKIMITAHKLGMAKDEFVFLHTIPIQGPEYLPLTIDTGAPDDDIVFQAYKHLVTMSFHLPDYNKLSPFIETVARDAERNYSHPYSLDEKNNEITLAIPELIYAIGTVLSESALPVDRMTTKHFRQAFLNKSFETGIRRLMIGSDGMRMSNTIYSRLNTTTRQFEPAWYYDFPSKIISKTSILADEWNGVYAAPANEPTCGYRHDRCQSEQNDMRSIIIGCICGILIVCAAGFGYVFGFVLRRGPIDLSNWWHLEGEALQFPFSKNISTTRKEDSLIPKYDSVISMAKLGGEIVWMRSEPVFITQNDLLANHPLRVHLAQLRLLRHDNVGHFVGLHLAKQKLSIVWEAGRRTMRSLFSSETIVSDAAVQLFFIFNVLTGLAYIHDASSAFFHGSLSSLCVVLDSRFTAKLVDVASIVVMQSVSKSSRLSKTDVLMPPENDNPEFCGSKEADLYALGVLLIEICNGVKATPDDLLKFNTARLF